MPIGLSPLGQVSLTVRDVDAAEAFYGTALGLRKLFRFGNLLFYDLAGVRLIIESGGEGGGGTDFVPSSSVLYFRTPDLRVAKRELEARGVRFTDEPHRIAALEDHDLWMVFFKDPDGNVLALMQEAPKGYVPAPLP